MNRWFADLPIEHKLRLVITVDAIIAMAKSLGLATVAEGVETQTQWQYLKNQGANQVQGFLFCPPLAITELERWHADWLHSDQLRAASVA